MESLYGKLDAAKRKRQADLVWRAHDAAHFVLGRFRNEVRTGQLSICLSGEHSHYVFDPEEVAAPPGSAFSVADWWDYSAYVVQVIRASTGLRLEWDGRGHPFRLYASHPTANAACPTSSSPAPACPAPACPAPASPAPASPAPASPAPASPAPRVVRPMSGTPEPRVDSPALAAARAPADERNGVSAWSQLYWDRPGEGPHKAERAPDTGRQ